jgi:AcrR family transcriptional regulator
VTTAPKGTITTVQKTARVGRPRAIPDTTPDLSPREQILLAAAALFVDQGFGSTSTRAIADAVGMRQASLYYHFAGKDDILAELLDRSVRPSTDLARELLARAGTDPRASAAALYRLAAADAELLAAAPHNIGSLYLIPEVRDARFDVFRAQRGELQEIYGRLGRHARNLAAEPDPSIPPAVPSLRSPPISPDELPEPLLAALLLQTVEVVIPLRRTAAAPPDTAAVARAVLRLVGLDRAQIRAAEADAAQF